MSELTVFECTGCGGPHLSRLDVRQCTGSSFVLKSQSTERKYRPVDEPVWVIASWERMEDDSLYRGIHGVRGSEESMRDAVIDVIRQHHGALPQMVLISDATIVYTNSQQNIPEGEFWVTRSGTCAWTARFQVSAYQHELEADMEMDV